MVLCRNDIRARITGNDGLAFGFAYQNHKTSIYITISYLLYYRLMMAFRDVV